MYEEDQKLFIAGIANEKITDRMDEILEPSGVDVGNFLKNRVLLMDHLYMTSAVIGRVYDLKTQDNGVHFEAYIGDPQKGPLTQQQKDCRSLVAQRLVQTVSVGFMPLKIQAPMFDNDGKLQQPAIIMEWELLELSVVAVPANPGAVFDLKNANSFNTMEKQANPRLTNEKNTPTINFATKAKESDGTTVCELVFDKEYYDKEAALEWAKAHDYSISECIDEEKSYKICQRDKADFDESSLKTMQVDDGIKALVGKLKTDIEEEEKMEKMLEEILESIKGVGTQLGSLSDSIKSIGDNNNTILSKLDSFDLGEAKGDKPKGDKPKDEMEEEEKKPKMEEEKEDEEKEEDEMKKEFSSLAATVKTQEKTIEKLTEKMDIVAQSLLKMLENHNG